MMFVSNGCGSLFLRKYTAVFAERQQIAKSRIMEIATDKTHKDSFTANKLVLSNDKEWSEDREEQKQLIQVQYVKAEEDSN